MKGLLHGFCATVTTLCALSAAASATASPDQARVDPWKQVDAQKHLAVSDDCRFASKLEDKTDHIELRLGTILLEEDGNCLVDTPLASVHPGPKALLMVKVEGNIEHVFVLLGNASVTIGSRVTILHAGDEAVVTDNLNPNSATRSIGYIGSRRLQMETLSDNRSLVVAEFSIFHALQTEPVLYRVTHSSDAHDKAIKDHLIKLAAALDLATRRHGPYASSGL